MKLRKWNAWRDDERKWTNQEGPLAPPSLSKDDIPRVKRVRGPALKLFAYLRADSMPWHSWSLVRSVIMRY